LSGEYGYSRGFRQQFLANLNADKIGRIVEGGQISAFPDYILDIIVHNYGV